MSLFAVFFVLIVSASVLISLVLFNKNKSTTELFAQEKSKTTVLEEKFNSTKKELTALKDELAKKSKFLEEARDFTKRKLKKDAIKLQGALDTSMEKEENTEVERLKSTIDAMKAQLSNLQSQNDKAINQAQSEAKTNFEKETSLLKQEIVSLKDLLHRRKKDADKQKQQVAVALPAIDVASLSDEAAHDMAKMLRKLDNYEKMYGVSQGKLQMSQERFAEMQKRYFAVCRELALAVGSDESADDMAVRNVAENIIIASEQTLKNNRSHAETLSLNNADSKVAN